MVFALHGRLLHTGRFMNNDEFIQKSIIAVSIVALAVMLIWLTIQTISTVLMVFAAIVLAIPLAWLADWGRCTFHVPRWISLCLAVMIILLILTGISLFMIPRAIGQYDALVRNLSEAIMELKGILGRYSWGASIAELLENPEMMLSISSNGESPATNEVMSQVLGIFGSTLTAITWPLTAVLMSMFLAAEPEIYTRGFVRVFPPEKRRRVREVLQHMGHIIRWWLFGQGISMIILGVSTTVVLVAAGIPLAFVLGLFTALMTFIPILGPILAGIPIILVSLSVSPGHALVVGIIYLVVQNVEGSYVTPLVHRRIIAMPPVLLISVQLILGNLTGFVGVLLAMPLVAILMVFIHMVYIEDILEKNHAHS